MILDCRDLNLLRLAGTCQCLPYESLGTVNRLEPIRREAELLARLGYLSLSRSRRYLTLTEQGYKYLARCGYDYTPSSKRPYASSPALRRRLETGGTALVCQAAGIESVDSVDGLRGQPVFLPSMALRAGAGNLMNAATCIGFGHWDNTAYLVQYAGEESSGLYLLNELSHLHKLSSVFDPQLTTPEAMLLAGKSYVSIHQMLTSRTPSLRHGKQGFVDYWAACDRLTIPVRLLSCDDVGIVQLMVMSQPNYRTRLARTSFGRRWSPIDAELPEADGHVEGCPLIIAIDMDLVRIRRVCEEALRQKRPEVMVAALDAQMKALLISALPREKHVRALGIGPQVLAAAFGTDFLMSPVDPKPADGPEGALVYV